MTTATRALLLDGSHAGDPTGPRAAGALDAALAARGHHPETITLRDKRIGNCAGDFGCWIKHPGICMTDDDNREIAAAIVNADLVAYLGPVTFGGPSAPLKRLVDHQIQNIAPNFITVDGETHHRKRYARYPGLLSVGWQSEPNAAEAAIFSTLAARNAINFHADASVAAVVPTALTDDEFRAAADGWLAALARGERLAARPLPAVEPEAGAAPKRALLLVGSPRTRTSTSNALGDHLLGRLAAAGVATETINLHPAARSTDPDGGAPRRGRGRGPGRPRIPPLRRLAPGTRHRGARAGRGRSPRSTRPARGPAVRRHRQLRLPGIAPQCGGARHLRPVRPAGRVRLGRRAFARGR